MAGNQHGTACRQAVQVLNKEIEHDVQQEGHLNQNVITSNHAAANPSSIHGESLSQVRVNAPQPVLCWILPNRAGHTFHLNPLKIKFVSVYHGVCTKNGAGRTSTPGV